ncbi:SDR family oxidoreductase [Pseudoruegeria sp. HB172150]|uniref:SDR family oxidoreductase n=1 Tax=Pseudoruegeria sp. HB172150 TaxID=2721164 RepID=UPI0015551ABE|nr:SDR family oxidoreductase [Pseudoruegeria sp. HB172150]
MRPSVLITGASSGIGAACARACAVAGYDVGIGYRSDRAGTEAVAADVEAAGAKAVLLQGDVAVPEEVDAIFAAFDAAFPRLHALVNNAGIVAEAARLDEMEPERLQRMFATNVTGAFLVARNAVRRMSTRHGGAGGAIVNISSVAARIGSPGLFIDYAASKGAIESLTTGLAQEVATEGIRVNAIRPGLIETAIHGKGGMSDRLAKIGHTVPIGRPGTAEEVAEAVIWLLSDKASYVTGAGLDVSGGR